MVIYFTYFKTAHWCGKAPEVPVFAYQTWKAAKLHYEHGENIYYSCNPGSIMVGIPKRQCVMGQWSPLKFRCSGMYSIGKVLLECIVNSYSTRASWICDDR